MRNMKLLLELCLLWTFLGVLTSHEISYEYHGNEQSDEQAIDHQQESAADHGEADMSNDLFPAQPPSTGNTPQEVHNGPNSRRNNLFNMTEEEERRWRIDMIKLQLLAQIDDLALPNMTVPVLPKPLRYRDEPVIQRDQPDQPKISQVVFFADPVRSHVERDGGIHIFFNLDSTYSYKHIHSVELWLYKQSSQRNHTYIVSRHSNQNHRGNNNGKPVILASERVSVKPGWVEFKDMTLRDKIMRWVTMVRRFPEQSSSNGHMLITCPTCDEGVALPIVTEGDKKPFLVINFKKINKRYKRHAEWCSENQGSCCKKMFKFNFHAEGLNMFVEPREYQPNYCQGSCVVRHFPETIHMASGPYVSVIMQSAAFQKRGKEPCCAPNKLTSTTVLYYNRNMHMVRKTLENMVVESCGCH